MKFTKLLFSLLLFMSGYTALRAQVPKTISYQGYLKNGGTAVTGTHDIAFNIYTVSTGGTSIWSETFPSLTFANGNFSVVLGKTTALTFTPLNTLYVGITIDATPEISPRVELTGSLYSLGLALPYAASINSTQPVLNLTNSGTGNVITATGKIQATSFQGDGSLLTGVTSIAADGSVTGGTAGPGVKIATTTITDANISNSAAIAGTKINPNFGAQNVIGNALTATAFSPIGAQQGAYLQWNRSSGEGETWLLNQRGSGGATAGIRFGDASSANVVTEWMRIIQNGNVGIGTTSPGQKLSVQGGVNVDNGDAGNGSIVNGLSFGFGSGEGIASKRNPGGNQFGLDFYTQTVNRMSITNTGNVGIGTTNPAEQLHLSGRIQLDNQSGTAGGNKLYANAGNLYWGSTNLSGSVAGAIVNNGNSFGGALSIGTNDNQPLELKVNATRAMRISFTNATSAPNILAGYSGNTITNSVVGSAILSGGSDVQINQVTDNYSVIGGGSLNRAGNNDADLGNASAATVSGGNWNKATSSFATVGGGYNNEASGNSAVVAGGRNAIASGEAAGVLSGEVNKATGYRSAVVGGNASTASGDNSFVGGGEFNGATGSFSAVSGGRNNLASGQMSSIPGGQGLFARSFGETALGIFNIDYTPASSTAFNASDRLFVIGNGTSLSSTSNALTILKNGNVGIGNVNPSEKVDVTGNLKFSGALMPNNTAGTAGQVLTSAGAGLPPTWSAVGGSNWGLTGTSGTVDGTNFIGTTDNVALSFRVNNQKAGRIDPAGPVFLGYQAGANNANATAKLNTGIGSNSLLQNTTGNYNVAIGSSALEKNTTGAENTAVGATALQNNTTGVFNSGFGYGALYTNSTGSYNTAFGNFSGVGNTTGNYNTAYGNNSLYTNTVGGNNTSIGNQTLSANSAGSNGTAIGAFAMQYYNDSSSPFVNNNVAVGYSALQGSGTPSANTGIQNSAVGYQAMAINTSGQRNAAFGYQAMSSNTTGNGNTAVGQSALTTNALGGANTALGTRALFNNIASNNTAVGNDALFSNTNAGDNAAFGVLSLSANTGAKNTGLGAYSLQSNTTGADNAGVGNSVLLSTTTGSQNTAVGSLAGYTNTPANANTTGSANTFIGYASGPGTPTQLTNATAIGANSSVMASNTIQLGNASVTTVNVGTGTTAKLVAGQLQITGGTLGAGRVLTSDAGGNATWQPASGTSFSNVNSDFQFANGAARKISIAPEPNTGDAFALTIKGSDATSGSQARNGGDVAIDGGHNYNISIGSSMPGSVYLRSGGNLFSGGNSQPGDIILQTGGITSSASNYTTRLIVKGNGNVGIGITTPSSPLHVVGDAKITGNILFGTASLAITAQSSGEFNFNGFLNPSADNTYQLGQGSKRWSSIWAAVGTINTSDARQKKNIKNIGYGLPEVLKLRPVSFEWKKGDGRTKLGLIAQETLEVLPEVVAVPTNKEDAYGMYYSDIIPVLVKATQELNTKLEGEKAKNQLLETESKKKIAELEKMLQNLKGENSKLSAEVTETKIKQEQEIATLKKQMEKIMNIVGAEAKK